MDVRPFRDGDALSLFQVFYSSVHDIAYRDYAPEQIDAWAPAETDMAKWSERMRHLAPFVVEADDVAIAYADLQPTGYIDHFYVTGAYSRRGAGRLLMAAIHEKAHRCDIAVLTSDVSRTAQPFFAYFGFDVVEQRSVEIRGVVVPNASMRKLL